MSPEHFPPEYFPPNYFALGSSYEGVETGFELMHKRTAIRTAVINLLIAAGTSAGPRVFDTHPDPIIEAEFPCIVVFGTDDRLDRQHEPDEITAVGRRLRRFELAIKATVPIIERKNFGAEVDVIAEQIETVMDANPLLNQTAETVWFERSEFGMLKGEILAGIVYLTYSVEYRG